MIRIAVDAMGGDFAPEEIIKGTILAILKNSNLEINLYGKKERILFLLKKYTNSIDELHTIEKKIKIIHTDVFLKMDVDNVRDNLKNNSNASMFLSLKDAKEGKVDGVVSAGPTQALILASYLMIKRFNFMKKIALAPIYNSFDNRARILLDAGANIDVKPENLLGFAICATVVAQEFLRIKKPQVKLLNIGVESTKGRKIDLETYSLLKKQSNINFGGNEEPNNLLTSSADILLSDGFTSNVVLKSYKGAINDFNQIFKNILTSNFVSKIITKIFFYRKIAKMKKKIDANEIGGAMILGLKKIIIKAHGSSNAYAFSRAILQCNKLIEKNVIGKISKHFDVK